MADIFFLALALTVTLTIVPAVPVLARAHQNWSLVGAQVCPRLATKTHQRSVARTVEPVLSPVLVRAHQ